MVVLAGRQGGEGKSFVLMPLYSVYEGEGMVFDLPSKKGSGNFPLLNLPVAKVVFLDEFRFDTEVMDYAT